MEIYRRGNVEIRMRFDTQRRKAYGDIYCYDKKAKKYYPVGKVDEKGDFYINTKVILDYERVAISLNCENLREEIEDYIKMWEKLH